MPFFPQAVLEPEQGFGRGVGCQQVDTEQNRRVTAGKRGQIKPTHQALDDDMMGQKYCIGELGRLGTDRTGQRFIQQWGCRSRLGR